MRRSLKDDVHYLTTKMQNYDLVHEALSCFNKRVFLSKLKRRRKEYLQLIFKK